MNLSRLILILVSLCLYIACDDDEGSSEADQLIGVWESGRLIVQDCNNPDDNVQTDADGCFDPILGNSFCIKNIYDFKTNDSGTLIDSSILFTQSSEQMDFTYSLNGDVLELCPAGQPADSCGTVIYKRISSDSMNFVQMDQQPGGCISILGFKRR